MKLRFFKLIAKGNHKGGVLYAPEKWQYPIACDGQNVKNWQSLNVELRHGMFKGNFGQILNKFTWGGLNSLVGNIVAHGLNIFGAIDRVTEMEGMLALSGVTKGNSAFTIGHLSFGPDNYTADWRDHLFVHEYGHYIQSQRFGPFYLKVVGVSSLLSAAFTSSWGRHNPR